MGLKRIQEAKEKQAVMVTVLIADELVEEKSSEPLMLVVERIDTFYPSSQTCSCCGYQNRVAKNLGIRKWTCPQCNIQHDMDGNADRNILSKALNMQKSA